MSLLLNIIPFFWLCCLGLVCCYLTRKKILWNESWWNEFYRLLIPSLFILREESMPFDSPTHLFLSLSVLRSSKKSAIFKNINFIFNIILFFLSKLFPNFYRFFKIRFYGTLCPFSSHCDIFYSVCHLTIQH